MSTPRQSLTLALLQAREAAMSFFRPSLNEHGLTEQQWRIIRILEQHGELEIYQLAELACILKPSMTGVLVRMEAAGMVHRRKAEQDQRRVLITLADKGKASFESMSQCMEANYQRLQDQFGEEKFQTLLGLLDDLKNIKR
ncbi:MAG: homoprotocatechuate degradation operon regulator, HpaR [Pseudomonadales bacterium RIFCSPLOWO2_12_60_38]|jgi:homoprotocatechuate degradation regulator HpaR|uniref:HTH marR-type domain-containing protein n=4 Tax=Pseudomonas TaxID=286 RepID=A0A3M5UJN6_PSESX|nr:MULTISPECIES: homoprotocatechuate degradation operon regulator HpaR [Pseudomonas]AFJ57105.1 homoprotocatechuate degradation operon regulator HpaR [Pseudomonas fluorescens A506]ETK42189.1 homoprotocatechuate degradation operon regulator HpaR [Pseudomonas fluorescens FH5]MDN5402237.1 homoprotocatechuate degradation operon regulator HpaR [Pseudomonas sp.]MDN5430255.1 homoprotocatechuate degradation operon regulator HpaR [Pseudomonadales bacterium]NLT90613.1 homoprotocatechuate degradation oper